MGSYFALFAIVLGLVAGAIKLIEQKTIAHLESERLVIAQRVKDDASEKILARSQEEALSHQRRAEDLDAVLMAIQDPVMDEEVGICRPGCDPGW